jgi:anionic cell wall polymer biosynthesis LytR-Cps2A-Psr (LCP) family protein
VRIESYGEIAEWVSSSDNYIVLEPNEARSVMVFVSVPRGAKVPDYKKGKLRILFIRT